MTKMTLRRSTALLFLFAGLCLILCCCKKKKTSDPADAEEPFDKQGLLQNMADNLVLPGYTAFNSSLDSLGLAYASFKTSFSTGDLKLVQQKLNVAYLNYQRISLYEFGPAEQEMLRMNLDVFPTDTVQIKANITSGAYNLADAANDDTRGLPALDYLFYDYGKTEAQIIQSFSASPNRQNYASAVIAAMKTKIATVLSGWNSSYKNQFVNSLGNDIGSSTGFLVNQINFELDYLKNMKFGIPLGKKTLGIPLPNSCEGYYSSQSLDYALANLTAIENAYLGKSPAGNDGKGFDDYLDHLNAAYTNGSLNDAIKTQFKNARIKLQAISGPLSTQVVNGPAPVNEAYAELAKLLVLLKTDMPSALGVVITYQDGDGD